MKKFAALLLCVLMALSVAATAFAAEENIYALALSYVDEMTELVKKAAEEVYAKPDCPKKIGRKSSKTDPGGYVPGNPVHPI